MRTCDKVLTTHLGTVNHPGFRELVEAGHAYLEMQYCHKNIIFKSNF